MNFCRILLGMQIFSQMFLKSGSSSEKCSEAQTCSECMKTHYTCKWCKDEQFSAPRCQSNSSLTEIGSSKCKDWTFPVSLIQKTVLEFNDTVQVKPSRIKITNLRPGEEKQISISVKSSKDYPLDMYYLMDFSHSMKDDLEELKDLSSQIVGSLEEISPNYGIGFGTFVDKPTFPYANSEPGRLEMPCSELPCQAVHSFNHEMSVTSGDEAVNDFKDKLKNVNISSNIDVPEGGLDAIVQVAVCSQIIGWREIARRVIFYASDAVFHMAGDGRLAGIVRPNRAQCGMDGGNKYTQSLNEDYPSIGQLNKVLMEQQIIPIFAVTSGVVSDYEDLSNNLTQLSSVGKLSDNSDDVVKLIKEKLEDIVKKTQLNPETPPGINVTVTPHCTGNQEVMDNSRGCRNVEMEEEVKFSITVTVGECKPEGKNSYDFTIEVPGIAKIPVSVSMTCDCPCEEESAISRNSTSCLGSGDLVCGECQCHEDSEKTVCTDSSDCGGPESGRCICGACDCHDQRYGEFCECSNFTCPRDSEGKLCSGNGDCVCGTCQCRTENGTALFTGTDCGCSVSKDSCMQGDLECSGPSHGECVCGECQCKAGQYRGKFCDICDDCGPLNCTLYTKCVTCVHQNGGSADTCDCPGEVSLSEGATVNSATIKGRNKLCPITYDLDKSCDINFYILYTDHGDTKQRTLDRIIIDRELDCPTPPNIAAIVAGGVGGIFAIGVLILVLWKVYTSWADKREWNKFLDERSNARWNSLVSPVYKDPTTVYKNPLFKPAADEHDS